MSRFVFEKMAFKVKGRNSCSIITFILQRQDFCILFFMIYDKIASKECFKILLYSRYRSDVLMKVESALHKKLQWRQHTYLVAK